MKLAFKSGSVGRPERTRTGELPKDTLEKI
jgi:hypothetical protein